MPFIPVSLVIHLALTSVMSVAWAIVTLRLFGIRHPASRSLILAASVLMPAGGLVAHLLYPHGCTGRISLSSHFACLAGSALGQAGTVLLASSLTVATSQVLAAWAAQRRAIRQSTPLDRFDWGDQGLSDKVHDAARMIEGMAKTRLPIMVAPWPGVCCTAGTFHPVILVSEDLCRMMDESELVAALAHEVAHIARHDNGIGLASVILRALTFFSPAGYVGLDLYMYEREKAADDLAVLITGDRLALASAIVKVARAGGLQPASVANGSPGAAGGTVTLRVQRLLDGASGLKQARLPFVLASVAGLVLITLYVC